MAPAASPNSAHGSRPVSLHAREADRGQLRRRRPGTARSPSSISPRASASSARTVPITNAPPKPGAVVREPLDLGDQRARPRRAGPPRSRARRAGRAPGSRRRWPRAVEHRDRRARVLRRLRGACPSWALRRAGHRCAASRRSTGRRRPRRGPGPARPASTAPARVAVVLEVVRRPESRQRAGLAVGAVRHVDERQPVEGARRVFDVLRRQHGDQARGTRCRWSGRRTSSSSARHDGAFAISPTMVLSADGGGG